MDVTPIRTEEIDDRDLVMFAERVRAVALRFPSVVPLTSQLLVLLEHAPDDVLEEALSFFEFCMKRPTLAFFLTSTAGLFGKYATSADSTGTPDIAR